MTADGAAVRDAKGNKIKLSLGALPEGVSYRLQGRDDAPEVFVEGPEDAICIHMAGYSVQAALGAGRLHKLIPSGRRVVIFADNDAAGTGLALDKAIAGLIAQGCAVAIAHAPAPHKDANDLLQAEGAGAVAAAIERATPWTPPGGSLPTYYPERGKVRAAGMFQMHKAIMGAVQAAYHVADVRKAARGARTRAEDALTLNVNGINSGRIAPSARRKAILEAKAEVSAETGIPVFELKFRGMPKGRVSLIVSDVAAGKSYAMAQAIREHGKAHTTWVLGPTLDKTREACVEYNDQASPGDPTGVLWPGYSAKDGEGKRYCLRPDVMDAALRAGVEEIGASLCDDRKGSRCPHYARCPLQTLRRQAHEAANRSAPSAHPAARRRRARIPYR